MAFGPNIHGKKKGGKVEVVTDFLFLGSKTLLMMTAAMKSEDICFFVGKL